MRTNQISFTGVIGVYGDAKTMSKVTSLLKKVPNIDCSNVTDKYINRTGEGLLTQVAKNGNDVSLIVYGKTDVRNAHMMEHGWGSINGISQHIKEVVNLNNYDFPSFIKQMKNLAKTK